jgi:mono/diheme cytochrome c family protein
MTFALTIPSALSLYSLGFTIYRSDFQWTAASTALFLGIVGWLLAGLSGVINATIAFDEIVHNTLWIVGHFHHMAMLNIGFAIFAATYAYLPELTGNRLWSEGLAKAHVWITFVAGSGFFAVWLVEGLEGAPRRFSVLPERFDSFTIAAIPFGLTLALAQVLYFANVVQTMRGAAGRLDEPRKARSRKERRRRVELASLEAAYVLISIGLAFAAGAAGYAIGHATRPSGGGGAVSTETAPPSTETEAAAGKGVFASAGCATCHTLSAAGSNGQVGPNLDQTRLSADQIAEIVTNGRGGMPSFSESLDAMQIEQVAAFVAESSESSK